MAQVTQEELRDREMAIIDEYRTIYGAVNDAAVYSLIVADRLERWTPIIKGLEVPKAIKKWVGMMTAVYGPEVLMHHQTRAGWPGYKVDWITALVLVMYGEAEYFWPDELGDEDVKRAHAWINGKKVPPVITYIPKEG